MFSQQDYGNRAPGGVPYGTNMPPELMQNHPYGRLPYGQQNMGMYTQNQPLPPGQLMAQSLIIIIFFCSCSATHLPGRQEPSRVMIYLFVFPQEVQV